MMYDLDHWRARFVLEALRTLEEKWECIVKNTDDEDIQADYGMDLAKLGILRDGFERQAVEEFGPQIKTFSGEPIVNMTAEAVLARYGHDADHERQS